jgi:hypothetical protein
LKAKCKFDEGKAISYAQYRGFNQRAAGRQLSQNS